MGTPFEIKEHSPHISKPTNKRPLIVLALIAGGVFAAWHYWPKLAPKLGIGARWREIGSWSGVGKDTTDTKPFRSKSGVIRFTWSASFEKEGNGFFVVYLVSKGEPRRVIDARPKRVTKVQTLSKGYHFPVSPGAGGSKTFILPSGYYMLQVRFRSGSDFGGMWHIKAEEWVED